MSPADVHTYIYICTHRGIWTHQGENHGVGARGDEEGEEAGGEGGEEAEAEEVGPACLMNFWVWRSVCFWERFVCSVWGVEKGWGWLG